TAKWTAEGIEYTEEGFATLLSGPLGPDDPQRSEETPAVLMLKLTAHNPGSSAATAHVWLASSPAEKVTYENNELHAGRGQLLRARVRWPEGAKVAPAAVPDEKQELEGLHAELALGPRETQTAFIDLPYIPRLAADETKRLAELDYNAERQRVVAYWREI